MPGHPQVTIARSMLPSPMYDLDGKQYTIHDLIGDELRASMGMERRFRLPEPEPPVPPTRRELARKRVARWLREIADRVWEDDEWEDE